MSRWHPIATRYHREETRLGHEEEVPEHLALRARDGVIEIARLGDLGAEACPVPSIRLAHRSVPGTIEQLDLLEQLLARRDELKAALRRLAEAG